MTAISQQNKRVRSLIPTKDQLLTLGDLEDFKDEMLNELKRIIKECIGQPGKKWLKSSEVKKLPGISHGFDFYPCALELIARSRFHKNQITNNTIAIRTTTPMGLRFFRCFNTVRFMVADFWDKY